MIVCDSLCRRKLTFKDDVLRSPCAYFVRQTEPKILSLVHLKHMSIEEIFLKGDKEETLVHVVQLTAEGSQVIPTHF